MALLKLFPAATRACIVAADLVLLTVDRFDGDGFIAAVEGESGRRRHRWGWRRRFAANGLHMEEPIERIALDAFHHAGEHVEAFALVFDERIFLPVSAQTDAVAKMIHAEQVVFPMLI